MALTRAYNSNQDVIEAYRARFYATLACLWRLDVYPYFPVEMRVALWDYLRWPVRCINDMLRSECYDVLHGELGEQRGAICSVLPLSALCHMLDVYYMDDPGMSTKSYAPTNHSLYDAIETDIAERVSVITDFDVSTLDRWLLTWLRGSLPLSDATRLAELLGNVHVGALLNAHKGDLVSTSSTQLLPAYRARVLQVHDDTVDARYELGPVNDDEEMTWLDPVWGSGRHGTMLCDAYGFASHTVGFKTRYMQFIRLNVRKPCLYRPEKSRRDRGRKRGRERMSRSPGTDRAKTKKKLCETP